jgi:hypothetical protein
MRVQLHVHIFRIYRETLSRFHAPLQPPCCHGMTASRGEMARNLKIAVKKNQHFRFTISGVSIIQQAGAGLIKK